MMSAAMQRAIASPLHGCRFETSPRELNDCIPEQGSNRQNRANAPNSGVGTLVALNKLNLSVQGNRDTGSKRGGARNTANRPSNALKPAQIANLRAAERYSRQIGLPFTRMITIHWKAAGIALEGLASATGQFIDKLTKWLARRKHRTAWVWVHENAGDKCWHCHILIHVPASVVAELPAAQRRWLRQITGRRYARRAIHSKSIGGRLGLEVSNPPLHLENVHTALAYILKGGAAQVGKPRLEPQGLVLGRRCSTSQNIARKARSKGNAR
ncbi:MAG: hypothetical protein ABJP34_03560 [Erythrobacter sp.]